MRRSLMAVLMLLALGVGVLCGAAAGLSGRAEAVELTERVEAPVVAGQKLGEMVVSVSGVEQQTIPVVADQAVERLTMPGIFKRFLDILFMAG